jgi:scyllo-inositol 2-dehydrogenase (NADP+)
MTLRAGLIGYGLGGRVLQAPVIVAAGFELAAVVTSRADEVRADFPKADTVASAEALCARSAIDLVCIASPNYLHFAQAKMALEAGKHVVVDKPFASTSAEALALVELAEKQQRVLCCFQNRRWDSDFLTIRRLIQENTLGELLLYSARWDRYRTEAREPWRDADEPGAGAIYDLGAHQIDQMLALFGTPEWVQADLVAQRVGVTAPDCYDLRFGIGKLRISLSSATIAADTQRYFRLLGRKASFLKYGFDPQEPQLKKGVSPNDPNFGTDPQEFWGVLTDPSGASKTVRSENGVWRKLYEGVRAAIETGGPSPVPPRESARVIGIIEAAIESEKAGRRIALPEFLAARGV